VGLQVQYGMIPVGTRARIGMNDGDPTA
jgi:hypothetical protein